MDETEAKIMELFLKEPGAKRFTEIKRELTPWLLSRGLSEGSLDVKLTRKLKQLTEKHILRRTDKGHRKVYYSLEDSAFYRFPVPRLLENKIVMVVDKGRSSRQSAFALSDYSPLEGRVLNALRKLREEHYVKVTLNDIANKVGQSPKEIEEYAYQLAPGEGLEIAERSVKFDIAVAR